MSATGSIRSSHRRTTRICFWREAPRVFLSNTATWHFASRTLPGRKLASVVYRDGGEETADLYGRFSAWLAGGAA